MQFLKLRGIDNLPYRRWPAESNGVKGIGGTALFYHPRVCDQCHGPIVKTAESYGQYAKRNFCCHSCKTMYQYKTGNPPRRYDQLICNICMQVIPLQYKSRKKSLQNHKYEHHSM